MAAKKKKTKHVRYTAPDFGAVFDSITNIVHEEMDDFVDDELDVFYNHLKQYIESNLARPEETSAAIRMGRIRYERRKRRLGFGSISLIRTGRYLSGIEVKIWKRSRDTNPVRPTSSGTVTVSHDKNAANGSLDLRTLGKLLEYGYVRPIRAKRSGSQQKSRGTELTRIPARPHWRPAILWYRATRKLHIPAMLTRRIRNRLKADLNWRT